MTIYANNEIAYFCGKRQFVRNALNNCYLESSTQQHNIKNIQVQLSTLLFYAEEVIKLNFSELCKKNICVKFNFLINNLTITISIIFLFYFLIRFTIFVFRIIITLQFNTSFNGYILQLFTFC